MERPGEFLWETLTQAEDCHLGVLLQMESLTASWEACTFETLEWTKLEEWHKSGGQ